MPAQPVALTRLVNTGTNRRSDGTVVLEGAALKILKTTAGTAEPQNNMNQYKGRWSEDRQLVWQPLGKGESLTLEIPVDSTGKFEIKAKFTMAPDYGQIRLAMDTRPLLNGRARGLLLQRHSPRTVALAGHRFSGQGETPPDDHGSGQEREVTRLPRRHR